VHFAAGGLTFAIAIPLGLLFARVRFDPRVFSAPQLERLTGLSVMATVPPYLTSGDHTRNRARMIAAVLLVVGTLVAYGIVYWTKMGIHG
jgi:hypothetical protein